VDVFFSVRPGIKKEKKYTVGEYIL